MWDGLSSKIGLPPRYVYSSLGSLLWSLIEQQAHTFFSNSLLSCPVPLQFPSPRGFLPAAYQFTIKQSSHRPLSRSRTSSLSRSPIPHLSTLSTHPFSNSLLYIAESTKRGISDSAKLLALRLREDFHYSISTRILFKVQKPGVSRIDFDKLSLFGSLHCASIFGVDQIIVCSVGVGGCNIN